MVCKKKKKKLEIKKSFLLEGFTLFVKCLQQVDKRFDQTQSAVTASSMAIY